MESSFKVIVFTPVWGRHEILKLWALGVDRLMHQTPQIEIEALCVVSNKEDKDLVLSLGLEWVECENKPLGKKHNAGLEALRGRKFDYILQLGSDDLASNNYLNYALPAMVAGLDIFGVSALYFCEPKTEKACRFELSTQANKLIGAGRFISHRAIKALDYKLWPDDVNKGLDMTSQANLSAKGFVPHIINTTDICILDVKSETNIWPYKTFGDYYPAVDYQEATKNFPEL